MEAENLSARCLTIYPGGGTCLWCTLPMRYLWDANSGITASGR
ncbi:hypothetical protein PROFUN_13081 [Planoprotostelium fungivorum]|uniref:Uncharacterized protein n=1 Tax=Planoprotostelium fungivorum TaxID=1890364 RepID=A0A2P6N5H2_9EUKA|nr:hypothetical protein PROFUN_13081 [Planoprotostelium fungivorum]